MTKLEKVFDVISKAPMAICTTMNAESYPESRALLNLANAAQYPELSRRIISVRNGIELYFTTNTSSSKIQQIGANPRVALYYCLAGEFRGVWVSGDMEIISDSRIKKEFWTEGWEMYYPLGCEDTDYTLMRVKAKRIRAYADFSVLELAGAELVG